MERIDKMLARTFNITRSEAKRAIRSGNVTVNGQAVLSPEEKFPCDVAVTLNGKEIVLKKYVYIMMNKPEGVISSTKGESKTVIDILPDDMKRKNLFPAGRLDRDTTGFMLITDDGDFAHRILSPKNHIDKTYVARLDKPFDETVVNDFESGMCLDGKKLEKACLSPVDGDYKTAQIVLHQGIYHQVKRMFEKHGITVTRLKRTAMGRLPLDETLKAGEARYLSDDEIKLIET